MKIVNKIVGRALYEIRKMELSYKVDKWKAMGNISDEAVFHEEASITNLNMDKSSLRIGRFSHVRGGIYIYHHGEVSIGDYCYIGENTKIWSAKKIEIGNRVLISHNVNIADSTSHPIDAHKRHQHYMSIITEGFPDIDLDAKEIIIKDDAWINQNTVLLRGITIGKGAIIGAGSVVTHDIPDSVFACGNPAQIVRSLDG